jgi:hypothetical protein
MATLLGCETPRVWTRPLRKLTRRTSRGFEAVAFARDVLGIDLFPWQRWLLIHLLELLPDGSYRFRTAVVLVARQNGKTTLMQILALWRMYVDGANLVIGTAQNLDVAEEAWTGAVDMAEGVPELAAEIAAVDRTNGKKALRLETGERYKVAAASRRGGRGLSGDLVLLDELREHQSWDAWGAVTKTTMARPNPQILCLSNAGDEMSIVLEHLRQQGYATVHGEGERSLGIFEWSAPPGCAMDDRSGWRQANPALGYAAFGEASILAALATDPEQVFRTEVLCQHVALLLPSPISKAAWADRAGADGFPSGQVAFALSAAWPDAEWGSIVVAGQNGDEVWTQLVEYKRGVSWMPARMRELQDKHHPVATVLDDKDPAAVAKAALLKAGVNLTPLTATQAGQAYGMFIAAAGGDKPYLRHYDQPALNVALDAAQKRQRGDAHTWDIKGSIDISPVVAATDALFGLATQQAKPFFASWR